MPRHHDLPATPKTVHFSTFDAAIPPALTVESGDTVTLQCLSGAPDVLPPKGSGLTVLPDHLEVIRALNVKQPGHFMTGPVAVRGAEPGDALEIRIERVQLRQDWGHNSIRPLSGSLPEDFPIRRTLHIPIDRERRIARLPWGGELPLHPFFGVMGVAPPPLWGAVSSGPPRANGGNMDNKELIEGSTLFLPVFVPGANFSAGDGHACQGDGEVNSNGLETALEGTFRLILHKGLGLAMPRAETPTHYISVGLDLDLDDAAKQAVREMIEIVCGRTNLAREDAYSLLSLAGDLHVTQIVDGIKGVHMMLAKSALHG